MPYGVFGAERVRYSYATCKYERACKEIGLPMILWAFAGCFCFCYCFPKLRLVSVTENVILLFRRNI